MHRSILAAAAAIAIGAGIPASAQSSRETEFTLTPYLWIAWPEGDIHTQFGDGSGPPPEFNVNFDDVSLAGIFTGAAEARFGRFGVFGDITYYEIEAEKNIDIVGDVFVDGTFDVGGLKGMLTGYWRAYDSGHAQVDFLAGVHYLEANLEVNLVTANRTFDGETGDDWIDPVVGVRGAAAFTEHFGVDGFAMYGGFGVASDELYDLYGAAYWRFNDTFKATAGWRYFADKFSGDLVDYEVSFSGPLAGLSISF